MEPALIALIAIIAAPIVILTALRINATLVFLSLCLGSVLTQYMSEDANFVVSMSASNVPQTGSVPVSTVQLSLLLLPVVLTSLFMIKTVHGRPKLLLNVLPAAGVGFLGALMAVPYLPQATAATLTASSLWLQVTRLQDLIVGASALMCLFVLWLQRPKTGHHEGGKHGKHHGH